MAVSIETERVIQPCLRDDYYRNKDAKLKAWQEICEAVNSNFEGSSDEEKNKLVCTYLFNKYYYFVKEQICHLRQSNLQIDLLLCCLTLYRNTDITIASSS